VFDRKLLTLTKRQLDFLLSLVQIHMTNLGINQVYDNEFQS